MNNNKIEFARMQHYYECARAAQPDVQKEALQLAIDAGDTESAASIARTIRDRLLQDSDARMALDRMGLAIPAGSTFTSWLGFLQTLGKTLLGDWATYRQLLRDLPEQPGFPLAIRWPVAPDRVDQDRL